MLVFIEHLFEHSSQPSHRFPLPSLHTTNIKLLRLHCRSSANSAASSTILASAARFYTISKLSIAKTLRNLRNLAKRKTYLRNLAKLVFVKACENSYLRNLANLAKQT